jgi:hypothetical protein
MLIRPALKRFFFGLEPHSSRALSLRKQTSQDRSGAVVVIFGTATGATVTRMLLKNNNLRPPHLHVTSVYQGDNHEFAGVMRTAARHFRFDAQNRARGASKWQKTGLAAGSLRARFSLDVRAVGGLA